MLRPLFVNAKNEWMKESEAKAMFRLAISRALQIRDGVEPSREVVAKFTLYSNKVGKKVHMDATPSVDGTLTRQMGGWAPIAGDTPYSRIVPSAIGQTHAVVNSTELVTLE